MSINQRLYFSQNKPGNETVPWNRWSTPTGFPWTPHHKYLSWTRPLHSTTLCPLEQHHSNSYFDGLVQSCRSPGTCPSPPSWLSYLPRMKTMWKPYREIWVMLQQHSPRMPMAVSPAEWRRASPTECRATLIILPSHKGKIVGKNK